MSGDNLAYQLRPNKAVDRNLFITLLNKLNRVINISDYTYYGFGGPFLEDFKLIHSNLRIGSMVSIEKSEHVHLRQKFNSPLGCIKFEKKKSGELIEGNDFSEPTIFWLDYVAPAEIGDQLNEISYLLSKLKTNDIVKITVNCNPASLGGNGQPHELKDIRLGILESRLNDYFPVGTIADDITRKRYPSVLLKAIELAVKKGMHGKSLSYFQPLLSFTYQDGGHPMMTVTGIILQNDDSSTVDFFDKSRLKHWPMGTYDWSGPREINLPELSVKERIFIDTMLPTSDKDQIKNALGYSIDEDDDKMLSLIQNYIDYYRMYPLFSRVVL